MKPAMKQITNFGVKLVPGQAIQFEDSTFETEDKKEAKFIEEHRLFTRGEIIKEKSVKQMEEELLKKADKIKAKRAKK